MSRICMLTMRASPACYALPQKTLGTRRDASSVAVNLRLHTRHETSKTIVELVEWFAGGERPDIKDRSAGRKGRFTLPRAFQNQEQGYAFLAGRRRQDVHHTGARTGYEPVGRAGRVVGADGPGFLRIRASPRAESDGRGDRTSLCAQRDEVQDRSGISESADEVFLT